MTLHVLHAGDGYEYLTSQVATADREREHGQELTDYYSAHGTPPPGTWFGGGLEDLARMDADTEIADEHRISDGATVSEPQMKHSSGRACTPPTPTLWLRRQSRVGWTRRRPSKSSTRPQVPGLRQ